MGVDRVIITIVTYFVILKTTSGTVFSNHFNCKRRFRGKLKTVKPLSVDVINVVYTTPSVNTFLNPTLAPFFATVKSSPSITTYVILKISSNNLPLTLTLTGARRTTVLSKLNLKKSFNYVVAFTLPVSLSVYSRRDHPSITHNLITNVVTTPFDLFTITTIVKCKFKSILQLKLPTFTITTVLTLLLAFYHSTTIQNYLLIKQLVVTTFIILLTYTTVRR